jgi:DnaJ domain
MYATLGISANTSEAQIKKAYHIMAIKLHPDRKGGDTSKFQQLQTAYQEILKKRRIEGASMIDPEATAEDETATINAEGLMAELYELLDTVKVAAEQCAMLAQLCIQGQKMMENAALDEEPLFAMNNLLSEGTSLGKISQQVIEPLETGCEYLQSIAAKAMLLPSLGVKYGNSTALVGGFTRCVEKCMSSGLESLRSVTEVMSADLQLSTLCSRLSNASVLPCVLQQKKQSMPRR